MFRTSALVIAALFATSTEAVRLDSMMLARGDDEVKGSGSGGEKPAKEEGDDKEESSGEKPEGDKPEGDKPAKGEKPAKGDAPAKEEDAPAAKTLAQLRRRRHH